LAAAALLLHRAAGTALWARARDEDPASTDDPRPRHTIALHGDLTGPDRASGRAQDQGLRLAVEQFNSRPGQPFRLTVRTEDDGGDPVRARRAAGKLAADPAVLAVLGPTTDATAEAALSVYDTALLPVVTVSTGATVLTVTGNRSAQHTRLPDSALGIYLDIHLRGYTSARRVGILVDRAGGDHALEIGRTLTKALRRGGLPPLPEVISALDDDLGAPARTLPAAGADAVVYTGSPERAALFARELDRRRFTGPRVGLHPLLDPRFLDAAGDAAEGWVLLAPIGDPALAAKGAAFTAAHRRRFGGPPAHYAAEAYDAAGLVLAALGRLRTARPAREDLLTAIRAQPYQGLTRSISFTKDTGALVIAADNNVHRWRVRDGAFRCEGPAPLAVPA
uniref:branched-chain amino acid ABC transporter substrate-binding protein n=1 Tax=Streptomyces sp. ODS05-4 TaxID=2944939 RepID=UPI00210E58DA